MSLSHLQNKSPRTLPLRSSEGGTFVNACNTPSVSPRLLQMAQRKNLRACTHVNSHGMCPLRHLHRVPQRKKVPQKELQRCSQNLCSISTPKCEPPTDTQKYGLQRPSGILLGTPKSLPQYDQDLTTDTSPNLPSDTSDSRSLPQNMHPEPSYKPPKGGPKYTLRVIVESRVVPRV